MKLIISIVTYNEITAKYLPYFLESLKKQTFKDFKIIVHDNSENERIDYKKTICNYFETSEFYYSGGNIGFAKAHNIVIRKAIKLKAKYLLVINTDILLENDAIEKMILSIEQDENLASVAPKILKWDFINNKKTNIIDTCGIREISALRFVDIGQGQTDKNQFDNNL